MRTVYDDVSDGTVPGRKDYLQQWGISALALGKVKYVGESETYEVSFRFDPYDPTTTETWGVDMGAEVFWPIDVGALASGTYLFCPDENAFSRCRSYMLLWDKVREGIGGENH